ncbi:hypothetical protein HY486_02485 [Candidatus Woesearchaeota archaeon]|nr:hypothetical protein [Candidatus Woesearchaeota archaeon]
MNKDFPYTVDVISRARKLGQCTDKEPGAYASALVELVMQTRPGEVRVNCSASEFSVRSDGEGISEESLKQAFTTQAGSSNIPGLVYSAFAISPLEIILDSAHNGSAVQLRIDALGHQTFEKSSLKNGMHVVVKKREGSHDNAVAKIIERCKYSSVPVYLGKKKVNIDIKSRCVVDFSAGNTRAVAGLLCEEQKGVSGKLLLLRNNVLVYSATSTIGSGKYVIIDSPDIPMVPSTAALESEKTVQDLTQSAVKGIYLLNLEIVKKFIEHPDDKEFHEPFGVLAKGIMSNLPLEVIGLRARNNRLGDLESAVVTADVFKDVYNRKLSLADISDFLSINQRSKILFFSRENTLPEEGDGLVLDFSEIDFTRVFFDIFCTPSRYIPIKDYDSYLCNVQRKATLTRAMCIGGKHAKKGANILLAPFSGINNPVIKTVSAAGIYIAGAGALAVNAYSVGDVILDVVSTGAIACGAIGGVCLTGYVAAKATNVAYDFGNEVIAKNEKSINRMKDSTRKNYRRVKGAVSRAYNLVFDASCSAGNAIKQGSAYLIDNCASASKKVSESARHSFITTKVLVPSFNAVKHAATRHTQDADSQEKSDSFAVSRMLRNYFERRVYERHAINEANKARMESLVRMMSFALSDMHGFGFNLIDFNHCQECGMHFNNKHTLVQQDYEGLHVGIGRNASEFVLVADKKIPELVYALIPLIHAKGVVSDCVSRDHALEVHAEMLERAMLACDNSPSAVALFYYSKNNKLKLENYLSGLDDFQRMRAVCRIVSKGRRNELDFWLGNAYPDEVAFAATLNQAEFLVENCYYAAFVRRLEVMDEASRSRFLFNAVFGSKAKGLQLNSELTQSLFYKTRAKLIRSYSAPAIFELINEEKALAHGNLCRALSVVAKKVIQESDKYEFYEREVADESKY